METFWFFWLRFRRAYDSAYDSDFWFSLGHKRSYDSAYDSDSVASENQSFTVRVDVWILNSVYRTETSPEAYHPDYFFFMISNTV